MILLPERSWETRETKSKGRGLFTSKEIKKGTVIGDYTGTVIRTTDALKEDDTNFYLMYYSDQASIYPEDIMAPGLHIVNHSCEPNSGMFIYKGHTLFFALRNITKGEEITTHYLLAPDPYCNPCLHICKCETKKCTGTMHLTAEKYKKWDSYREVISKQTKRAPIRYGKPLLSLDNYPTYIESDPIYNELFQ